MTDPFDQEEIQPKVGITLLNALRYLVCAIGQELFVRTCQHYIFFILCCICGYKGKQLGK